MFSLEKVSENPWIISPFARFAVSVYFLQINQTHQTIQIQLFDWIQISNLK
jgi:NADH-quinone oxidoreductase subunit L